LDLAFAPAPALRSAAQGYAGDPAGLPAEEVPFTVSGIAYRDLYLGQGGLSDRVAAGIRRRYGTWPFDLPMADACLEGPASIDISPSARPLAWDRLPAAEAIEVCLARVLNRFAEVEGAMQWLAAQGLRLEDSLPDDALPGHVYWFGWSPTTPGGPMTWWNALSSDRRGGLTGLSVMIETCTDLATCGQLAAPQQTPPFFRATVTPVSAHQK
jgi:hypothetical protein